MFPDPSPKPRAALGVEKTTLALKYGAGHNASNPERRAMTASEQLSIWAEASDDILVGVTYGDNPYVVQQIKASDAIVGFSRHSALIDVARVTELKGVTCIVVEGRFPEPGAAYRAILSSAERFR